MKVKIYIGMPMQEKFLTEIEIGDNYNNCKITPRKNDVIIVDDESYVVKIVLLDYDDDECCLFVKRYEWGEKI